MLDKIFSITEESKGERVYKVLRFLGIKFKKRIRKGQIYLINGESRKKVKKIKGLSVVFGGTDAVIEIGSENIPKFKNCKIYCSSNSLIRFGSSTKEISNIFIKCGINSKIIIGEEFSVNSMVIMNAEPNLKISIGDDCMFSTSIYLRSHDGHTIYNEDTKDVLNFPEDIKIGNHVWFGNGVRVLKGANIPDNSVVGIGSIVTKSSIPSEAKSGSIFAGIPAKVLKTGCNWSRKSVSDFLAEQQLGESDE